MSRRQKKLSAKLNKMLEDYRNPYHMATEKGDCYGLVYRCLNGGFSPTLYKKYIRPEPRKRCRLIIDCPPELKAQFETQRGELSRVEHLVNLMRRDYGELEY